jgi:predicted small lipoprotein YifL
VRRLLVAAALILLAGCGSSGPLELVRAEPPDGAEDRGTVGQSAKSSERQSTPLYRVRAPDGSELSYAVTVRNTGEEPVEITGVEQDRDRDGAFVPERVADAPVRIAAGDDAELTIEGRVDGCRFGGQTVAIAGPELKIDGDDAQALGLPIRVELVAEGC